MEYIVYCTNGEIVARIYNNKKQAKKMIKKLSKQNKKLKFCMSIAKKTSNTTFTVED